MKKTLFFGVVGLLSMSAYAQVQPYMLPPPVQPVQLQAPQIRVDNQNQMQTYTSPSGQVVGRSYQQGNTTTYTDQSGGVVGRSYQNGNTRTYVTPSGETVMRSYGN